jgi:hypothetical protein
MAFVADATAVRRAPVHGHAAYDRVFYGTMAAVLALVVFAGFGRTYYFRFLSGGPQSTFSGGPFTALVHLHGALFTAWVLLFVVQTALVATRRVAAHRRLGIGGAGLAVAMIGVGLTTAVASAKRGGSPPGVDPLAFMAIPFFDMLVFATLVIPALLWRHKKETHKRLMLFAYISIITAAIARIPGVAGSAPPVFFGLSLLFVVAAALYDLVTRRTIHRAYLWGGTLIFVSVPLRLAISSTAAWHAFAAVLTR